jgi:hypothetical protein
LPLPGGEAEATGAAVAAGFEDAAAEEEEEEEEEDEDEDALAAGRVIKLLADVDPLCRAEGRMAELGGEGFSGGLALLLALLLLP